MNLKFGEYDWFDVNAKNVRQEFAHKFSLKKPNPWGLHDMHGNVLEWCSDWMEDDDVPCSSSHDGPDCPLGCGWSHQRGSCSSVWCNTTEVPILKPGDIVVMDNLCAHKVAGIQEAIKA